MDLKLSVIILGLSQLISATIPPSDCSYKAPRHLQCKLTSINSRLEKTDFSVVPNNTLSLSVYCSQSTVGQLEPYGFSKLAQLQRLVLENCVLTSLPSNAFRGLHSLKTLSVRKSRSAAQGLTSDNQLDIQHGALLDLDNLEYVEVRNPKWSDQRKLTIDCEVNFNHVDFETWSPFCADPNDVTTHGVAIYERIIAGDFGEIAEPDFLATQQQRWSKLSFGFCTSAE